MKTEQMSNTIVKSRKRIKPRWTVTICAFVILFLIAPTVIAIIVHNQGANMRVDSPTISRWLRYEDVEGYPRRLTNFYSGGNRLQAYVYGEHNDKGLIVISHGLGWGAERYFVETMYFVDNGWRVFMYNNTGTHSSEGRGTRGLPQAVLDLDAALTYIANQNWDIPIKLYGHSWGGYAVAAVLSKGHDISAVVSLAAFATPMGVMLEVARDYIGLGFIATFSYPHLWVYHRLRFGQHAGLCAIDGINSVNVPVKVIHGTEDHFISYNGASIIAQRDRVTNPNVLFVSQSSPHQNGHSNLWRDSDAVVFMYEVDAILDNKLDYYGGEIPYESRAAFYTEIRNRVSAIDIEFMNMINEFFERHLN